MSIVNTVKSVMGNRQQQAQAPVMGGQPAPQPLQGGLTQEQIAANNSRIAAAGAQPQVERTQEEVAAQNKISEIEGRARNENRTELTDEEYREYQAAHEVLQRGAEQRGERMPDYREEDPGRQGTDEVDDGDFEGDEDRIGQTDNGANAAPMAEDLNVRAVLNPASVFVKAQPNRSNSGIQRFNADTTSPEYRRQARKEATRSNEDAAHATKITSLRYVDLGHNGGHLHITGTAANGDEFTEVHTIASKPSIFDMLNELARLGR